VTARIYLHVGSPKTGTTFLQQVLWSQREPAREQGLLLPMRSFHDHFLGTLDVREVTEPPAAPPQAAGMWKRLVEQAERWDGPSLISHELFAGATAEQAAAAMSAFRPETEVHLVLTVRDLVRQIPAEWQEHVKHRATATFPDFIADLRREDPDTWFWRVQDFADILDRWGAGLPPERVHVVTVPQAGTPPSLLWERFAGLFGIDPAPFDLDVARANTSLGYEQAELLRRVNAALGDRLPRPGPYPGVVKDLFAQQILVQRQGVKLALEGEALTFAVEKSAESAERLAKRGYSVVGDLDELVPQSLGSGGKGQDYVPSAEQLLDESVAALAGLLDEYHKLRQRADRAASRAPAASRSVRGRLVRLSERSPAAMRLRLRYARTRDALRRRD
jgi:hypothetical protein